MTASFRIPGSGELFPFRNDLRRTCPLAIPPSLCTHSLLPPSSASLLQAYKGRVVHYKLATSPYLYYARVLALMRDKWRPHFEQTMAHPLRHPTDVLTPILHHAFVLNEGPQYQIQGKIPKDSLRADHLNIPLKGSFEEAKRAIESLESKRPRFFTVGDCTSERVGEFFMAWLQRMYPTPSSFERQDL